MSGPHVVATPLHNLCFNVHKFSVDLLQCAASKSTFCSTPFQFVCLLVGGNFADCTVYSLILCSQFLGCMQYLISRENKCLK